MNIPNIRYYARLEDCTGNGKTPKYVVTAQAGYYPPMDEIVGRDGKISMFLQVSKDSGSNDDAPEMRLQAKNSLNFTGLKNYFVNGRLSGFAYGYPNKAKTYSKKKKPNPFFDYKEDLYLFVMHQDQTAATEPEKIKLSCIELLVLSGGKELDAMYCKMLQMGGFDEALAALRKQAKQVDAL